MYKKESVQVLFSLKGGIETQLLKSFVTKKNPYIILKPTKAEQLKNTNKPTNVFKFSKNKKKFSRTTKNPCVANRVWIKNNVLNIPKKIPNISLALYSKGFTDTILSYSLKV